MPRRPRYEITRHGDYWTLNLPASLTTSGKRERIYCRSHAEAKRHQAALRRAYHELGGKASSISPGLAEDATRAAETLSPFRATLSEAAREYADKRKAAGATVPLREAWSGYVTRLEDLARSERYLLDFERDGQKLPEWFLDMEVAAIEGSDIERALDGMTRRGANWNRILREVSAVMRWAKNTEARATPTRKSPPKILKDNDQARLLMRLAEEDGCALPFALMLFAGIRPQGELSRLRLDNIGRKWITLSHAQTKTASDRQIPILGNLRRWVAAWHQETVLPTNWAKRCRAIRKAAGIAGQQDILRHTFGSAFYRVHGEQETVEAMGHTAFKTFETYYKRAISLEDARDFFTISPGGESCAAPQSIRVA